MNSPSAPNNPSNSLPAAIGRYQPLSVLGRGGQGIVYLARDPELDRDVALKCLRQTGSNADRLRQEARNVARLDHPNIVTLFELELENSPPYLVYQFAPGEPLSPFCNTPSPMAIGRAVKIVSKVLEAVHYAHEQNVLHRDLTPNNILLDSGDLPRVLDFGLAVALTESTTSTDVAGTAGYMAPEVLNDQPAGPASDVFALSVILHELLTGQRLFHAENSLAVIYKILHERVLPPSDSRPGLEPALDEIVMRGLAKDPLDRYQSAAAMRDALEAYLAPSQKQPDPAPSNVDPRGAIAFLLRRVARKPDFPAVSRHISEINQKSSVRDESDANDLASVILKDFALTAKLLKVVNSAVYGQYGGTISTVSRAVVILGYEQVRAIALGIIVFEHLKDGALADQLKAAACSAFLSGTLAREILPSAAEALSEEAFVAAMFHHLGRHLAIYYFPDEYQEVRGLMENKDLDESQASQEVFGTTLYEFGISVGRDWGLPERLLQSMRPAPSEQAKPATTPEAQLAQTSAFSNSVVEILGSNSTSIDGPLMALMARYRNVFDLDKDGIKSAVNNAIQKAGNYAKLLNIDLGSTPLLARVRKAVNPTADESEANDNATGDSSSGPPSSGDTGPASEAQDLPDASSNRQEFLTNAVSELTTAIIEQAPINDMFTMVMEAIYRSLNCTHVLFLMRDARANRFVTRLGFGDDLDALKQAFSFEVEEAEDIFNQGARQGRNAVILDTEDPKQKAQLPGWCRELTAPRSALLFSIVVNRRCLGLIYADTVGRPLQIHTQELNLLNTLVKQLSLGMRPR